MYPTELVAPMKTDLTSAGFEDLHTPDQVDAALTRSGTVLCVVNSVCGCAAGAAAARADRVGGERSQPGDTLCGAR